MVLVFSRSVETGIEKGLDSGSNKGSSVTARIVVPSNQVGCLLGKGGAIVSEMRKATGANIRIIGGSQVPKCALENDDVVQVVQVRFTFCCSVKWFVFVFPNFIVGMMKQVNLMNSYEIQKYGEI